jgi:hypothetical protein
MASSNVLGSYIEHHLTKLASKADLIKGRKKSFSIIKDMI